MTLEEVETRIPAVNRAEILKFQVKVHTCINDFEGGVSS